MSITKNEIKYLKSLQTKKGRKESSFFLAEGVRLLEEAIHHKFMPKCIYFSPARLNERSDKLIKKFASKGIETIEVSAMNIERICATESTQGLLAIFKTPDISKLPDRKFRKLLWCENISDPGNLGSLVRSASAFGFESIILSGLVVEPYSPKVVRSSVGAIFGVKFYSGNYDSVLNLINETKSKLVAADLNGRPLSKNLLNYDHSTKLVLAIGSEADGLSDEIKNSADIRLKINHSDKVESLNAAIAGSILMSYFYTENED